MYLAFVGRRAGKGNHRVSDRKLRGEDLREFLVNNWLTHDALWYGEVASRFGMAEASPMNLRVCRSLGRIEFKRFLKATGASRPGGMAAFRELFDQAWRVFGPRAFDFEVDFRADDTLVVKTRECFAHKGMVRAGVIDEYACGIFERIEGWLDAMGLDYTRTPDLSRCLKHKGEECVVNIGFRFAKTEDPVR
jgi:Family of unknown function (DUF6125)